MTNPPSHPTPTGDPVAERFARTIIELAPYAGDIVYVGGWVQRLYLDEALAPGRPVHTEDIDISLPRRLEREGRPPFLELAWRAGFDIDPMAERDDAPLRMVHEGADGTLIDLDLLTEGERPDLPVRIEGQPALAAQGYPGQVVLLENARWTLAGPAIHPLLDPPRRIRVPAIGAYVMQKGVSSVTRNVHGKAAKDLVYVYELVRRGELWLLIREEMVGLARRYPDAYATWRARLAEGAAAGHLRRDVARQLIHGGQASGEEVDVEASVAARFARVLAETPGDSDE